MKRIRLFSATLLLLCTQLAAYTQVRRIIDFDYNWKFLKGNDSLASRVNYNDSKWRSVSLPHDWSIESDFSNIYPATNQGGALPGGIGWYRKKFSVPVLTKDKVTHIEFDGVYRNSEVWINGHYLGKRPSGYVSFSYDLTPYLFINKENVISVKVDNSEQPNSRWYTGSGIYRDVRLVIKSPVSFQHEGTFIYCGNVDRSKATVFVHSEIVNANISNPAWRVDCNIYDPSGKLVSKISSIKGENTLREGTLFKLKTDISRPKLWAPSSPYLYRAVFRVYSSSILMDEYDVVFGIRTFYFDSQKGFFLNDRPLKIKGVCLHHDLGALGAAFNKSAARRQLQLLKEMGCNAIRTAHNPPAPGFLDLCDEMGFLVLDEAFDMWKKKKNKFDYHLDFDTWGEKDLSAMVLRDRNHPSVFMWSIGNEIREQFDSTGISITRKLVSDIKKLDPTRPVTSAMTENDPAKNFIYQSHALDVLGFNYKSGDYPELPLRFPGQKFIATETASALATRGVYDWPSDSMRIWPPDSKQPFASGNADMTVSAYDDTYAYWGNTHERAWLAVKDNPFIAGCFVWCGVDFLGEPVPYPWPARSSYYGIIDLAGFPKDVYYMYQSEWTDKPVLHLFPHWNGKIGQLVDVWGYYNNADEVELYLNGRSLGVREKSDSILHVMWRVPFQPGVLKAVSRKNGKTVLQREMRTAGKPALIRLSYDENKEANDKKSLYFITAEIIDKNGIIVPDADNLLHFSVSGSAKIIGTDNGFEADTLCLKNPSRKAWKGRVLLLVLPINKKRNVTVTARSHGLRSESITIKSTN